MGFLIAISLPVLALAEIALLIAVGGWIGLWPTLLAVVAAAGAGAWLVRRQGLGALARARASLARNELPVAELLDGVCILAGGALLLVPGFLTDIAGLLLFLPPVRAGLLRLLRRRIEARMPGRGRPSGTVIDGDCVEIDPERALRHDHPWAPRGGRTGA